MAGGLHADAGLLGGRRVDDLALSSVDAVCVGGGGSAVRVSRAAAAGAVRRVGARGDRAAGGREYSVLRGDGAADSLVAVQWVPDDLGNTVLHYCRGIVDCGIVCVAREELQASRHGE